ncbi:MAG TPA: ABC transporter ATP-binding protein [Bacillota bacterium]|nr:ABC transporter ATP-binding protein [Bacillota bacterium]
MAKEVFGEILLKKVDVKVDEQTLLQGINLRITQGERIAIVGPNAAGKSTLLKVMAGELTPSSGEALLNGKRIREYTFKERARILTKVAQTVKVRSVFAVRDYVGMGRYPYLKFAKGLTRDDHHAIQQALQETELESLAERPVEALSGGEQQRVILAQALAQQTSLLLLDEPNSYLDMRFQISLMKLLMRMNKENDITVVAVLHDLNLAAAFANRIILVHEGKLVGDGDPYEILTEATIKRVYNLQATRIELPGSQQLHFVLGNLLE